MEAWQCDYIDSNLRLLTELTKLTTTLQADLQTLLSEDDMKELDARRNELKKSYYLYSILKTRINAYKVLTKALIIDSQSGAAKILVNGLEKHGIRKPLTHLGIPTDVNVFQDADIEVYEKKCKIHHFFPCKNRSFVNRLQEIFRDTIPELEFYETFVKKQKTFVLMRSTIPYEPLFYIDRHISNRIKFHKSIFKQDCPDVFVFKSTIEWYKVAQFGESVRSGTQLERITSRFICLEENEDWMDLKEVAEVPIHLINYSTEADQDIFLVEDTSAPSAILKKLGSQNERFYIPEKEFLEQQLSEDSASLSVCICASPGMGKTYLLINIARFMIENSTTNVIVYIPMSKLSTLLCDPNNPTLLVSLFKYASRENAELLYELVKAKLLQVKVFIDGYDEICSIKADWFKKMLKSVTTEFPEIRFFITSRPHMREELEQSLHTISYDILPFDHRKQMEFFEKILSINKQNCDEKLVPINVIRCLETINQSLSGSERLTENPRLCELAAEAVKIRKNNRSPINTCEILKRFIEKRIRILTTTKNQADVNEKSQEKFEDIKLVHTYHALKTLYPTESFHDDHIFRAINHQKMYPVILNIGIIQKHQYSNALNVPFTFIHGSLAAHLVAEYFSITLHNERILNKFLECVLDASDKEYVLYSKAVATFCDYALKDISDVVKTQVVNFCNTMSPQKLYTLLCACCQQNFKNTFSLLTEAVKIREYFTPANSNELLSICMQWKTGQMFYCCIQLFIELNVAQTIPSDKHDTVLQLAVKSMNFDAVAYLAKRVPLKCQNILKICMDNSLESDQAEIRIREQVLKLMLNQDQSLVHEGAIFSGIHPSLRNILHKFTATLTKDGSILGSEVNTLDTKLLTGPLGSLITTNNENSLENIKTSVFTISKNTELQDRDGNIMESLRSSHLNLNYDVPQVKRLKISSSSKTSLPKTSRRSHTVTSINKPRSCTSLPDRPTSITKMSSSNEFSESFKTSSKTPNHNRYKYNSSQRPKSRSRLGTSKQRTITNSKTTRHHRDYSRSSRSKSKSRTPEKGMTGSYTKSTERRRRHHRSSNYRSTSRSYQNRRTRSNFSKRRSSHHRSPTPMSRSRSRQLRRTRSKSTIRRCHHRSLSGSKSRPGSPQHRQTKYKSESTSRRRHHRSSSQSRSRGQTSTKEKRS